MIGAFSAAGGQLVTPKTVPVHQDEQFAIVPSARAGMGGVSIALDDSLADPFVNPARALFGRPATVFTAPFTHNITGGHGGGRTLPVGMLASNGDWSGAFVVAVQDLDHNPRSNPLNAGWLNRYGEASLARRLPNDLSVGLSVSAARLNAIDGFDLLYDGSDAIVQIGTMTDVRLGASKHWNKSRLDLLLVNARTDLTHAVSYNSWYYDYGTESDVGYYEVDHNADRTNVWGAHTQFVQSFDDGWRLGWIATANHLTHPKIPDYSVKNVPFVRFDPGATNAFDFGIGIGRSFGHTSFGIDLVQEPITSSTWGNATQDTRTSAGGVIPAGGRTVDNHFRFSNSHIRVGLSRDFSLGSDNGTLFGVQLGYVQDNVHYTLTQDDHVTGRHRDTNEGWADITPTFGLHLRLKGANVQYNVRLTCSYDCSRDFLPTGDKVTVPPAVGTPGIIAAPTQPVSRVDGGTAHVQQLLISVPIK